MKVVRERKHVDGSGSIVASVSEEDGSCAISIRCYVPDGRERALALGNVANPRYQSLVDAQRDADREVQRLGHECSGSCEQWVDSLTH
jgi:hypothetical protein